MTKCSCSMEGIIRKRVKELNSCKCNDDFCIHHAKLDELIEVATQLCKVHGWDRIAFMRRCGFCTPPSKWEHLQCPKCGSNYGFEVFGDNEAGCRHCMTHYELSKITDEEMIEWFVE